MCGIVAAFKTKPNQELDTKDVNEAIVNQYEDQYKRGTEGYGILAWNNKTKKPVLKRATEAAKFMFDLHAKSFPMMIIHHRNPTSSDNLVNQTHPLFVSHESLEFDYYLVHNGVITNANALILGHNAMGIKYRTLYRKHWIASTEEKFNDSESLAVEVALYIEGKTKRIGTLGAAAFISVQVDKTTGKVNRIYFGRKNNPLNMAKSRTELYLSSEGKGSSIEEEVLYSFAPSGTMDLKKQKMDFVSYYEPPAKTKDVAVERKSLQEEATEKILKQWEEEDTAEKTVGFHTPKEKDPFDEFDEDEAEFLSYNGRPVAPIIGFYQHPRLEELEDTAIALIQDYFTCLDQEDTYFAGRGLAPELITQLGEVFKDADEELGLIHYDNIRKEEGGYLPHG